MSAGSAGGRRVLTVYYDGECNLCLAAVDRLKRLHTRSELRFVTLQSVPPGSVGSVGSRSPQAGADDHLSQMLVKDESSGTVAGGSEAVLLLLMDMPRLAWLGRLGSLPGLRGVSRTGYRLIAKYRYRLFGKTDGCKDGTCRIGPHS
ncbi:thiol-disulfide oxidoreductase DCC family protein [Cohnella sp. 56]|uniref:thiol-disulfide oxidoreductase DCC family protein n=1 Tax=Cohnella sp. 56 TaxID=3113722 RepID=UPI0030E99329